MRAGVLTLGFAFSLLTLGALADVAVVACDARPRLRLVWVDVHRIADAARPAAFAEAAALLGTAGIRAAWEQNDGRQREVQPGEVVVVLVAEPPSPIGAEVMGAAQPSHGGMRVVWVYVGSVRQALGLPRSAPGMFRPIEAQRLGRALARVILHEVVHVTDPERPHALRGLMARRLDRSVLENGGLRVEPELHQVFRVAAGAGDTAPPETTVAASGGALISAALAPMVMD